MMAHIQWMRGLQEGGSCVVAAPAQIGDEGDCRIMNRGQVRVTSLDNEAQIVWETVEETVGERQIGRYHQRNEVRARGWGPVAQRHAHRLGHRVRYRHERTEEEVRIDPLHQFQEYDDR